MDFDSGDEASGGTAAWESWAAFDTALAGAGDVPAALDALTVLCMSEVQDTFARAGAPEAATLLAVATASEPTERRAKLAAALEIADERLDICAPPAEAQNLAKAQNLAEARSPAADPADDGAAPGADLGAVTRAALVAALISSELGGDPEIIRQRAVRAATAREAHLTTQRHLLTKKAYGDEFLASNRLFARVFRLLSNTVKPRRSGFRTGRRA